MTRIAPVRIVSKTKTTNRKTLTPQNRKCLPPVTFGWWLHDGRRDCTQCPYSPELRQSAGYTSGAGVMYSSTAGVARAMCSTMKCWCCAHACLRRNVLQECRPRQGNRTPCRCPRANLWAESPFRDLLLGVKEVPVRATAHTIHNRGLKIDQTTRGTCAFMKLTVGACDASG